MIRDGRGSLTGHSAAAGRHVVTQSSGFLILSVSIGSVYLYVHSYGLIQIWGAVLGWRSSSNQRLV